MGTYDPRVDKYIEKAADFAKPVLMKLRQLVHQACPDVEETIKWSMPAFVYKGPLCGMAAFKAHCVFGFWKSALLFQDDSSIGNASKSDSEKKLNWGAPGRDPIPAKIASLADLPSDSKIVKLIKQAKKLNDEGVKLERPKTKKAPIPIPTDFASALKGNTKAAKAFHAFSPSHQREYLEWIVEAKKDETRQRRIASALELLEEGKSKNWKYERQC